MEEPTRRTANQGVATLVISIIGIATLIGLGYLGLGCMAGSLMGSECGRGAGLSALGILAAGTGLSTLVWRWMTR